MIALAKNSAWREKVIFQKKGFTPLEKATDFNPVRSKSSKTTAIPLVQTSNGAKERSSLTGFTLFEVMVVIFIFSIVLIATYSVLTIARTSYQTGEVKITLQQEARKAMDRIATELREASSVNLGDEYPFTVWGERIKYEVVSGQLQRVVQGESPTVVANDVGNLQLSLFGGDMVYITLTTQKTTIFGYPVTTTLTSQIGLRN